MVPDVETSLPVSAGWIKVQASYGVGGGKSWLKNLSGGPLRFLLPHLAQGFWQRDVTYLQVEIPGFSSASSSGSTLLSITREWALSPQPCRWLRVWFHTLCMTWGGTLWWQEAWCGLQVPVLQSSYKGSTLHLTPVLSTLPMTAWYISEKLDFFDLATMGTSAAAIL